MIMDRLGMTATWWKKPVILLLHVDMPTGHSIYISCTISTQNAPTTLSTNSAFVAI